MSDTKNLIIRKGETYSHTVRWETDPVLFKAITAISATAPVRVTAVGHGLTSGWSVSLSSVKGPTELNAEHDPPYDSDLFEVSVVDSDKVDLVGVDGSALKTYVSGGFLRFNTAHSLASYTARMSIKDKVGGTELLRLDTSNARIVLDDTTKVIELSIDAATTAAITWKKGVYDLELVSVAGVVTTLMHGSVSVTNEVTTT